MFYFHFQQPSLLHFVPAVKLTYSIYRSLHDRLFVFTMYTAFRFHAHLIFVFSFFLVFNANFLFRLCALRAYSWPMHCSAASDKQATQNACGQYIDGIHKIKIIHAINNEKVFRVPGIDCIICLLRI